MSELQRVWCLTALAMGGSFVKSFAKTMLLADETNESILLPALSAMMGKYPDYTDRRMQARVID